MQIQTRTGWDISKGVIVMDKKSGGESLNIYLIFFSYVPLLLFVHFDVPI